MQALSKSNHEITLDFTRASDTRVLIPAVRLLQQNKKIRECKNYFLRPKSWIKELGKKLDQINLLKTRRII